MAQRHRLVETVEDRLRGLELEFHRAWWTSQIDAAPENDRRRAELELELRRAKGDPEMYAAVNAALDEDVHDPVLRRQLEVLRSSLAGNQMDEAHRARLVELSTSTESDFAAFRPEVDGHSMSDNEIEEVLKTSDDPVFRKRVWEASKEIGAVVADRVREMARVRNEVARALGYSDYYRMSLELQELPEAWLFDTLDAVERSTAGSFRLWKERLDDRLRKRFGADSLYPWHYADPFFQEAPPDGRVSLDRFFGEPVAASLAAATFSKWGIDISGVIAHSDLYPRARKSQHAFCIDIDRSGRDVRILGNVVPGERWVEVILHESGHAAYDVCIDPKLPWLLHRASHTFTTEAIALMCGRLVRDQRWLVEVAGLAEDDLRAIEVDLRASTTIPSLVLARWGLVVVHFERELYADPEGDLDSLWWDLAERFQFVQRPPDRSAADWAAKIHIAASPVYYQNYLLGDLLAAQIRRTCEAEFGGLVGVEAAGDLLVERVFAPGALLRWDALLEEATGRPLSVDDFAEEIATATAIPSV